MILFVNDSPSLARVIRCETNLHFKRPVCRQPLSSLPSLSLSSMLLFFTIASSQETRWAVLPQQQADSLAGLYHFSLSHRGAPADAASGVSQIHTAMGVQRAGGTPLLGREVQHHQGSGLDWWGGKKESESGCTWLPRVRAGGKLYLFVSNGCCHICLLLTGSIAPCCCAD